MKKTAIAAAVLMAASGVAQAEHLWTMTDGNFDFYDAGGALSGQYPDGFSHSDVQGAFNLATGEGAFSTSTPFSGATWTTEFTGMQFGPTDGSTAAAEFNWITQTWQDTFDGALYTCNLSGNLQSGCDAYNGTAPAAPSYNYTLFSEVNTATDTNRDGSLNLSTGYQFDLGAGMMAAGVFFDWTTNIDIPVLAVMQVTGQGVDAAGNVYMDIVSVDADGDGVPGTAMQTDPFPGQTPAFSGRLICSDCVATPEIPVPAAVWLFGSGLLGLAGVARRRKAS